MYSSFFFLPLLLFIHIMILSRFCLFRCLFFNCKQLQLIKSTELFRINCCRTFLLLILCFQPFLCSWHCFSALITAANYRMIVGCNCFLFQSAFVGDRLRNTFILPSIAYIFYALNHFGSIKDTNVAREENRNEKKNLLNFNIQYSFSCKFNKKPNKHDPLLLQTLQSISK